MQRRSFLKAGVTGALATWFGVTTNSSAADSVDHKSGDSKPLYRRLPRWRGFNLMEKISADSIKRAYDKPMPGNQPFRERDFEWISDWGFDFVRLPMDYHCWIDPEDPYRLNEKTLREIDQAVEWGRRYGVHVSLNMHHAPGYRVGRTVEPSLWTDEQPQRLFCFYWAEFAKRYRGIPSARLSFNLVNEPDRIKEKMCAKVCRRAIDAIRREDPKRLIIADGLLWGREPIFALADANIAQSTHWYQPRDLTHYQAPWRKQTNWPDPAWPMKKNDKVLDRKWLRNTYVRPWQELEAKGVGIHVGEWGILDTVPHDIALRWTSDVLGLWKEAGWGWSLWNFRGEHGFGFLDTHRKDVRYENFRGHRLDRKMLELLQES